MRTVTQTELREIMDAQQEAEGWRVDAQMWSDKAKELQAEVYALEQERDYCRKLLGTPDDEVFSSHIQFLIARKIQLQATVEAQTQRIAELTEAHKDEQATVEVQARRIEQLKAAEKRIAELEALLDKAEHGVCAETGTRCHPWCLRCEWEKLKGGAK